MKTKQESQQKEKYKPILIINLDVNPKQNTNKNSEVSEEDDTSYSG